MSSLTTFRVHFADGSSIDVDAANPFDARAAARKKHDGIITKVKRVKETAQ